MWTVHKGVTVLLLVSFGASPAAAKDAAAPATVIRHVTVIDPGTQGATEVPAYDLLLENGLITATGVIAQPAGAAAVDGSGKYLIPGLWDMHVHLWNSANQPDLYLRFGVTGVRDMGSDFTKTAALRRAIEEEEGLPGPHIITSGPGINGRRGADPKLPILVASTPEQARLAVEEVADRGVDFIKIFDGLELEPYLALMERARQLRLNVSGHLPTAVRLEAAIEMRQTAIEHFFGLEKAREKVLRQAFAMAARADVHFTPTLTMHKRTLLQAKANPYVSLVSPEVRAEWTDPDEDWRKASPQFREKAPPTWRRYQELARWLKESGAPILVGTDTGDPLTVPGASLHDELQELAEAGFTPLELLRAATSEAAIVAGLGDRCGKIETGVWADLVLLTANPLERIANVARIDTVWWRGRVRYRATAAAL